MSNYWLDKLEMWTNMNFSDGICYVIAHDQDDLVKIVQKMKQVTGNAGAKVCKTDWRRMDADESITYLDSSGRHAKRVKLILQTYVRGYFYKEF